MPSRTLATALAMLAHRLNAGHELAKNAPLLCSLVGLRHRLRPPQGSTPHSLPLLFLDRRLQGPLLLRGQVRRLVLAVHRQEPDLTVLLEVEVDPEASSPSLASPRVRPPHLAEAARALDDVPCFRVPRKMKLQLVVLVIAQIVGQELREQRRLDELHAR